ncbi:response regulator transcription factor [Phormidium sp. FACHB-592]|nr:response regulator transcription factor [Phormidium sp. FACHB-592]MBD2074259.1 response regulator transcription factor [Phormidium sp. FACHB-592]
MISTPLPTKNNFEPLKLPTQIDSFKNFPVKHALMHVAQTAAEALKHAYSVQVEYSNDTQTVSIRAIKPEYRHLMFVESLSPRELEVLQLIVEGDRNPIIAQKLYIAEATVKTHVRSILQKLCVSDRTQAAIRALRIGLVH